MNAAEPIKNGPHSSCVQRIKYRGEKLEKALSSGRGLMTMRAEGILYALPQLVVVPPADNAVADRRGDMPL